MKAVRRTVIAILVVALFAGVTSGVQTAGAGPAEITIGAVYPTGGMQGSGGTEEYHGVELAAAYVNDHGGVGGRPVRLRLVPADSYDAAPEAVDRLAGDGIRLVVGSYGSTISRPAAAAASRRGMLFWETGAVGELGMNPGLGTLVFRVPPTGGMLGRAAVRFVRDQLAPKRPLGRPLRYAVTYVDDVYGRSVGLGGLDEIRSSRLPLAGTFPYELRRVDYTVLARRITAARPDVLVVGAYLEDGVALRMTLVRARVPLVAAIGTSSSFCMPEFGRMLGAEALGLFASDKPDGDVLRTDGLAPEAARALAWAREAHRTRYRDAMGAPALAGFAGAIALFRHVLPQARDLTPDGVGRAARAAALPLGALPNGSGLQFAPPGSPDAGANLRAASVIWEWIRPNTRAVVWPPAFATNPIAFP